MTKRMRGVHVVQVPGRAMLAMSVLIVSLSLSLFLTHSANALPLGADKLLEGVLTPVTQLLPGNASQPSQPSNDSSNASAAPGATQSQGAPSQSSTMTNPASPPIAGATVVAGDAQTLEPVMPIDTSDMSQSLLPLAYLANMRSESSPGAALAGVTSSPALPIEASEEGWRLFGVTWYWWLLVGGILGYGLRYWIVQRRQHVAM